MNRLVARVGGFATLFVVATLMLGWSLRLWDRADADRATWQRVHRLSGIAAALTVVFAHSLSVVYFVGTSRWCKEVVDTYQLGEEFKRRSAGLKRQTFPVAVAGMLSALAIVASAGAADALPPLTVQPPWGLTWSNVHLLTAIAALMVSGYSFYVEWNNVALNHALIYEIYGHVQRIRAEKGLD